MEASTSYLTAILVIVKDYKEAKMNEVMTIEEIYDKFQSEWVLVENPEVTEMQEIIKGKVLFHSVDRDECDQKMLELRPRFFARIYTGKAPEDMAFLI